MNYPTTHMTLRDPRRIIEGSVWKRGNERRAVIFYHNVASNSVAYTIEFDGMSGLAPQRAINDGRLFLEDWVPDA